MRDPDLAKMKVSEFQDGSNQQAYQELYLFINLKLGSREFLEQRFGVDLLPWHKDETPAK